MSKKEYCAIAAIINEVRKQGVNTSEIFCSTLVSKLATYFDNDYSGAYAFNSAKFRAACYGKEDNE